MLAVAWMGAGFWGANALALAVTVVIAVVYLIGFAELCLFRRVTATLGRAFAALPAEPSASAARLDQWLLELHPSLRHALRRHVEGHRVGLPGPVVTPYLVGLLVMLGLLGTFVGLVDTLRGAVLALEGTNELAAIRAGLAAPIRGLSLAFGTSVAGVASSAMLGLGSTLSRRDRLLLLPQLEAGVDAAFGALSLDHSRQAAFRALQGQAEALPAVADRLDALAEKLEHMGAALGAHLSQQQERFHTAAEHSYTELAASVDRSLRDSLVQSGRLAADGVRPIVTEAMAGISAAAENTQAQLAATAQAQLAALGRGFEQATAAVLASFDRQSAGWIERQANAERERLQHWSDGLESAQRQAAAQAVDASRELVAEFRRVGEGQREAFADAARASGALAEQLSGQWQQAGARVDGLAATLAAALAALREQEEQRAQAAVERLAGLETAVAGQLAALGQSLEGPMARLLQEAAAAPRAAADVIAQLQQQGARIMERDSELLEERRHTLAALDGLARSLAEATAAQRTAVERLVASSAELLDGLGARFGEQVGAGLSQVAATADDIAASAGELSCLGEAFGLAVQLFAESSGSLAEKLAGIEQALERSTARSDEQMGYYVAQAREIIDQSLLSQQEVIEQLRRLGRDVERAATEAV